MDKPIRIYHDPDEDLEDDMRPEYDFFNARPNPSVNRPSAPPIILEPDVAAVLTTSEQVNAALRAILQAIPAPALRERVEAA